MFGEVVGLVVCTFAPVDNELALTNSVTHPIKSHVYCFGTALFDSVVDNSGGAGIVSLDVGCWLRMSHVGECGAKPDSIFSIEEKCS